MDRDYDGRLSFGEFMGEETPLEKVFKNMDKDGDGSVSKEVGKVLNPHNYMFSYSLGIYKAVQASDTTTS